MKILLLISFTIAAMVNSCSKNGTDFKEGTINLKLNGSVKGKIAGDNLKLSFDKVISDSRCPANAICIWQGAATATFTFTKNGEQHNLKLSTLTKTPEFNKDTIIGGYKIEFIHLLPYPGTFTPPAPVDSVKAEIKFTKL